jgi:hypothetical protein
VYHTDCLEVQQAARLGKVKRWFCPACTTGGVDHKTHKTSQHGDRPAMDLSLHAHKLARIEELCLKLPTGHCMGAG